MKVTAENVGEFFMIRAALGNRPRRNIPASPAPRVPPVIGRRAEIYAELAPGKQ